MTKSQTEITVETSRVVTLRRNNRHEVCPKQVAIVSADEVALETIRRLVETGHIRLSRADAAMVLMCLSSSGDRS